MHQLITGNKGLDRELNHPGADYHVGIVAGECGVGTSWVLLNLAMYNALNGRPTLFIATDDSKQSVLIRTHVIASWFKDQDHAKFTITQVDNFTEAKEAIVKWLECVDVYAARNGICVCLDGIDLLNMPAPAEPGRPYKAMGELNELALTFNLMLWTTVHTLGRNDLAPLACGVLCMPQIPLADLVLQLTALQDAGLCLDDQARLRKLTIVKDRYSGTTQGKFVYVKVGAE